MGSFFLSIGWRILRFRRIPNLSTCFLSEIYARVLCEEISRSPVSLPVQVRVRLRSSLIPDDTERSTLTKNNESGYDHGYKADQRFLKIGGRKKSRAKYVKFSQSFFLGEGEANLCFLSGTN